MRSPGRRTGQLEMDSTWGMIRVRAVGGRVVGVSLSPLRRRPAAAFRWKTSKISAGDPATRRVLRQSRAFVRACFDGRQGRRPAWRLPAAPAFTRRVWRRLVGIPCGSTLTYGAMAEELGAHGAARAVGRACGANRLPLIVPCHRVVAAGGRLGGYSGGLAWKQLLLAREASPDIARGSCNTRPLRRRRARAPAS